MAKPSVNDLTRSGAAGRFAPREYSDDRVFRIDAAPMPWDTLICTNLLFAAAFYGFHLLLKHLSLAPGGPSQFFAYAAPIGMFLVTCAGFTAALCYSVGGNPWLVYDKVTKRVDLPRRGVSFSRQEVVNLEYKTLMQHGPNGKDVKPSWRLSLVTCRNGELKKWSLVPSTIFLATGFEYFLVPLTRETDLPVVRIGKNTGTWDRLYTETPARPYATAELPEGILPAAPQDANEDKPSGGIAASQ
jgi:hypothetical protein